MKKFAILSLLLILFGCSNNPAKEIPLSQIGQGGIIQMDANAPANKEFGFEALLLYNITEKNLIENIHNEFNNGDSFGFVIYQLKGLASDWEGYSWYDVDMQVKDSGGNAVLDYLNLLGSSGKLKLQTETISIYGNITIPPFANPGEYGLTITVHDKLAQKTFAKTASFKVS